MSQSVRSLLSLQKENKNCKKTNVCSASRHAAQRGMTAVVSVETTPVAGSGQSESVAGGNPDVRTALLLDDGFDQVVHLLEAVAVHDGCRWTHTYKIKS